MIYIVKFKGEGRDRQSILRICTEQSELYKQMSNGELHRKRNCEYWPTCKCQKHAELIAYRPVVCNGVKAPRIQCMWDGSNWIPRFIGSITASEAAKARMRAEQNTDAGRAAQLSTISARRDEKREYSRKYCIEHRDTKREYDRKYHRKYDAENRDERREYMRKYYLEHKK